MKAKIYGISKTVVDILNQERIDIVLSTENERTVIDGGKILTNSVTADAIAANSVMARHIVADSITGDKILAGEITVDHLKTGTLLLPDTEYGGVKITTRGLILESLVNSIVINSTDGFKITNKKTATDIMSINADTGEMSLNVASLNINTLPVATNSQITDLSLKVNDKVDADKIIASFNLSKETAKLSAAKIDLLGYVSFSSFDKSTQESLNTAALNASSAKSTVTNWTVTGKTTIDGGKIEADTITGKQIKANSITTDHLTAGTILLPDTSYGGVKITNTGIIAESAVSNIFLDSLNGFRIQNKKTNLDILSVNGNTGEISMNVSKLTIGFAQIPAATKEDILDAMLESTTMVLTNDTALIGADKDGLNGDYSSAFTTAIMYVGSNDDTKNWTFSVSPSSGVGGNLTANTYKVTNMANDTGAVVITASKGTQMHQKTFTIAKAKAGKEGVDSYTVSIKSTNGLVFKNGVISTTLQAHVFAGKDEITDYLDANQFQWTKTNADGTPDSVWNNKNAGGKKSITISGTDIYRRATFDCNLIET